jgi:hypothetical protein
MNEYGEIIVAVGCTLGAVVLLWLLYALAQGGGSLARYFASRAVARRWLNDPAFAAKVNPLLAPAAPPEPAKPPKPSAEPLRLLALLQREGRLLDFLLEDIQGYANDQIGAAVRDIHRQCQSAVKEHLELAPVLGAQEGSTVDVPTGFDPSAIRLTGNVTGQPPFRGTLQHHGWRVTTIKLKAPPEGQDEFVLQPAEVELP